MVYAISYRRPGRVSRNASAYSLSGDEKKVSIEGSIRSGTSSISRGIPEALSFDAIIAGGTCPPCTLRDFMNFLKYIELSAENLQFFLWYRDYARRFINLPESEKVLSPEWIDKAGRGDKPEVPAVDAHTAAMLQGTDFAASETKVNNSDSNPFFTPPHTPNGPEKLPGESNESPDMSTTSTQVNHTQRAAQAFENAGLKWKPLTIQPYREEINRIISIYIADGGSRQLNLSSKERSALLHALQATTHPSAFRNVMVTVEWSLRCQAHPNFIRWTICNGNKPRVMFARVLGVIGILAGFVTAIVLTLSSAGRGWRAMALIGFLIGISTLIGAWKGMCIVLHGMHHRHLRPWELFSADDEPQEMSEKAFSAETLSTQTSSNSWEDEPWVANYEKRSLIRKIADREVWIQDPALRQIQDTIFLQAILGGIVSSGIIVGIFCALPKGNYF